VARLTGVSLCSVKRIAQEGPVVHVDDAAERAQRQVGRPSTVANFRKAILEILQHTPDLASLEILRRVRETGYAGGKTALYALGASLRPKSAKPLVRFEGLPGEFSQHDFGQIEVQFVDGASRVIDRQHRESVDVNSYGGHARDHRRLQRRWDIQGEHFTGAGTGGELAFDRGVAHILAESVKRQPVTSTATVTWAFSGTISGKVTFYDGTPSHLRRLGEASSCLLVKGLVAIRGVHIPSRGVLTPSSK
jgi:hypothetical protein